MINQDSRAQILNKLTETPQWDVIVIGGGVVGAGIFKFANQLGQNVLLLEQKDFAWGSSSRSSKMVHGGLRYVAQGQYKLTQEAVRERELLIDKAQGLVESTSYVMSHYQGKFPGLHVFGLLMRMYGHFAGKKQFRQLSVNEYNMLMPGVNQNKLTGGTQYVDALTDDARLVFRLIQEAKGHGAVAVNYAKVTKLVRDADEVKGVMVQPEELSTAIELKAKVVINATGAWANKLDPQVIIRPLRGSHMLVPSWRLPLSSVVTLLHPTDRRPVMIYPWQNTTLIGTTDLDHKPSLDCEPKMSLAEMDYLFAAVNSEFPDAKLTKEDVISTYAGVRPIVLDHPLDLNVAASHEKREHSVFCQPGFITVTGGKLTTFRVIANDVMDKAAKTLGLQKPLAKFLLFENASDSVGKASASYLAGRYGRFLDEFMHEMKAAEQFGGSKMMKPIRYSKILWAELLFGVKYEQIQHLDDLLLRRTRLGNVLPSGGKNELAQIQQLCQPHMTWSDQQWQQEVARYLDIWQQYYSVPAEATNE